MTRSLALAAFASCFVLPATAQAGTAAEEADRCGRILTALWERRVDVAASATEEETDPARQTDASRAKARRELDALLGFLTNVAGADPLRREHVADAPVPGSDILIRRELWLYPDNRAIRFGCVRYEAADGWTTQFQFGDSMETVTTNLERLARTKASAAPP